MSNPDTPDATPIEYYYDYHLSDEDRLTGWEYPDHSLYALYDILEQLFLDRPTFVALQPNLYATSDPTEIPLSPELAVFKGLEPGEDERNERRSWRVGNNSPAPSVVFEYTDHPAWQVENALHHKPARYGAIGVREVFVYDGLESWPEEITTRLRGWRFENGTGTELVANERGQLWSEELDSWVGTSGDYLLLYEPDGPARLSTFQVLELARGNYYAINGMDLIKEEWDEERGR